MRWQNNIHTSRSREIHTVETHETDKPEKIGVQSVRDTTKAHNSERGEREKGPFCDSCCDSFS